MKKRKGTARLITIDGYQVLKENNYSLEQVWLPHGSACFRGTRMILLNGTCRSVMPSYAALFLSSVAFCF